AVNSGPCVRLSDSRNCADGNGDAEDLQVMMVHQIAQARFADLIQALELIERKRIAVRHHEPVKENGQTLLAEGFYFANFAQHAAPLRNEKMQAVVGIDVRSDHAIDGTGKSAVQA